MIIHLTVRSMHLPAAVRFASTQPAPVKITKKKRPRVYYIPHAAKLWVSGGIECIESGRRARRKKRFPVTYCIAARLQISHRSFSLPSQHCNPTLRFHTVAWWLHEGHSLDIQY